jgi:hypothetical protein
VEADVPYAPVAQNLIGHGLPRRLGIAGIEFRDHRVATLDARDGH